MTNKLIWHCRECDKYFAQKDSGCAQRVCCPNCKLPDHVVVSRLDKQNAPKTT